MTQPPTPVPGDVRVVRALNPDTRLPMPSPSQAQRDLVTEVLAKLLADPNVAATLGLAGHPVDAVHDALVEVAARQHGRTLRACIDELRAQADGLDRDALTLTEAATGAGPLDPGKLSSAGRLAAAAATLRALVLRGSRA